MKIGLINGLSNIEENTNRKINVSATMPLSPSYNITKNSKCTIKQ